MSQDPKPAANESNDAEIVRWIGTIHAVDDEMAAKIWDRYFPGLVRLARDRIGTMPRRVFDEEDIAVSALRSFFRGAEEGRFDLRDQQDLWKLLVTITIRKVTAERRRFFSDKRGQGRVSGDSVFYQVNADGRLETFNDVLDEHLMPELADDVRRACEGLLEMLKNDKLRQTALLKMEGYTNTEIAADMNCSVARVKQRLAEIRSTWQNVGLS